MSFKSWIIKKFIPDDERIAEMLTDSFADWLNNLEISTTEKIEKTSNWTLKATAIVNELGTLLKDGKISQEERILLTEKLTPFVKQAKDKILEKI